MTWHLPCVRSTCNELLSPIFRSFFKLASLCDGRWDQMNLIIWGHTPNTTMTTTPTKAYEQFTLFRTPNKGSTVRPLHIQKPLRLFMMAAQNARTDRRSCFDRQKAWQAEGRAAHRSCQNNDRGSEYLPIVFCHGPDIIMPCNNQQDPILII